MVYEIKPAEVICQFDAKGNIIPILCRVFDEEDIKQTFKIKSYKKPLMRKRNERDCTGRPYSVPYMMDFTCKIEILGMEKIITLKYLIEKSEWKILY